MGARGAYRAKTAVPGAGGPGREGLRRSTQKAIAMQKGVEAIKVRCFSGGFTL
jgi:hypothetical protein